MTITDTFEIEIAKAIVGESAALPSHAGVATTNVTSIATNATSLSGEIGTRFSLTKTRSNNTMQFSCIRSSVDVLDTTNGDSLRSVGIMNTVTQPGGLLTGVPVSGVTQSTNFDVEIIFNLEVNRG